MKKTLLLLLASLALSGCGVAGPQGEQGLSAYEIYCKYHPDYNGTEEEWINSFLKDEPDDTKYDVYNNYVFNEIVIDGVRGYCVSGYYGTEEKIELNIPSSYRKLPVIGVSFSNYLDHYGDLFYRFKIDLIHFPSTVKLLNWGSLAYNISEKTKTIFDSDIKYLFMYPEGEDEYDSDIEKIYFTGTLDEFSNSNVDKFFRESDVYFKNGSDYELKIERREEIKNVLEEAANSKVIYDTACLLSNNNREIILPTELEINYKGELKKVSVSYHDVRNPYYYERDDEVILEGNKLKYVGQEDIGGKNVELYYDLIYKNVSRRTNISFAIIFTDVYKINKASLEGGAESYADTIINNIMNAIDGKKYSTLLPTSKFFLIFYSNDSERCDLLKYPLSASNRNVICIDVSEETSDTTSENSAFTQFLSRHEDFFAIAGANAYDTNYYANGYLSDIDIEYLETADPNNFLVPTILLVELNSIGNKCITEVAFGVQGDHVQDRQKFLNDMWNHEGPFAEKK